MRWKHKNFFRAEERNCLPALLLISFFFLFGVLLGQVFANRTPDSVISEIKRYLADYICLCGVRDFSSEAFFSTLWSYFRYPLLSLLLGFSSVGVLFLPCISVVFGFLLSYSVSCFVASFGTFGVFFSLAVFGLRCFVTLPCFLISAVYSFRSSLVLAGAAFGRSRRTASIHLGRGYFKLFSVLVMILVISVCVESFFSPLLLRLMLEHIPT